MSYLILSHNQGEGARNLAEALGCKLAKNDSTAKMPRKELLINFGCSAGNPVFMRAIHQDSRVINHPRSVEAASSKLRSFRSFENFQRNTGLEQFYPNFWTDKERAAYACAVDGKTIVARTLDRAAQGRGIEVFTPEFFNENRAGLPDAPVYTEAVNKGREYRVHCGFIGNAFVVIDITRKIRRPDLADEDRPFIWNHDNGFIFVRDGVSGDTIPNSLTATARKALTALQLDFGAVDIVVPRRGSRPARLMPTFALEVNTAPGMEGTTVERYAEFFRAMLAGDPMQFPSLDVPTTLPTELSED